MFSKDPEISKLLDRARELGDVSAAIAVLNWDQETYMPAKGAQARAKQLATLSGVYHQKLISLKIKETKRAFEAKNRYDRALVCEMKKLHDRAMRVPEKLVKEMSEATSQAFEAWREAKLASDFSMFALKLERVVGLKIKTAKLLKEPGQNTYDVMLDEFEPGLTEQEVTRVFEPLKIRLSEMAARLARLTHGADDVITKKKYDKQKQWELGLAIVRDMGYDLEAGRQDKSAHPFTITFSVNDVRITTWENEEDVRPALFATIHEAGHALYEQGVDPILDRLQLGETGGLGGGTGLAMHESQSRMWENMVGRSEWFWKKYYTSLKSQFPSLKDVTEKEFVKAVNVVRPSLVRVEADEVTYGLHIVARFEIERDLIAGKIKVTDLPKVWKGKYKELLGITPMNDAEGVLQDIHWAHGAFGYFPTYLLGTLMAAQLWHTITLDSKLNAQIQSGNLLALREWLREKIHKHGRLYTSKELLKRVTGEDLNPKYYLDYLEKKFKELYH